MNYREIVAELDAQIPDGWVDPTWQRNLSEMEQELLLDDGALDPDFVAITSRFCGSDGSETEAWRPHVEKRALKSPFPTADGLTIMQSSAFAELAEKIGMDFGSLGGVLVWGGGYGSQLAILKRLAPQATIIAVDIPISLVAQLEYCDQQGLPTSWAPEGKCEPGAINFVPLSGVAAVPHVDFFVATHSLSECPVALQNYVAHDRDWFDARYLMLAHAPNAFFNEDVFGNFDQLFQGFERQYPSAFCESEDWANPGERIFDRGQ